MDKKGLSPVVATVLLIGLVLVLSLIIFLWAKYFLPEQVEKFGSPIKDSCKDVNFEIAFANDVVSIQNKGNIPIYGVEIGKKTGFGSMEYSNYTGGSYTTRIGETNSFDFAASAGEQVVVVPVLLGETTDTKERKAYVCEDSSQSTTAE